MTPVTAQPFDYDAGKWIAQKGSWQDRAALAADANAPPELLLFLAADSSQGVRQALAGNPKLPLAAVRLLSRDAAFAVREAVGRALAGSYPELGGKTPPADAALAREALALLTVDTALSVRAAVATAIADVAVAAPEIAEKLALDAAEEVALPILRHYRHFEDTALIALLARRSEVWARRAIAQRASVSAEIVDAILAGEASALADGETLALLGNAGAKISPAAFGKLAQRARQELALHGPLSRRADLPGTAANVLAEFVDDAIFTTLAARADFDAETRAEIVATARRRLDWIEREQQGKLPAILRVRELFDAGKLSGAAADETIRDALAWRDEEFVPWALALMAKVPPATAAQMMADKNPKAIVALCWRAGLSARTALALQKNANIEPFRLLHPRGGTDYALPEADLRWQLEYYGVKV